MVTSAIDCKERVKLFGLRPPRGATLSGAIANVEAARGQILHPKGVTMRSRTCGRICGG